MENINEMINEMETVTDELVRSDKKLSATLCVGTGLGLYILGFMTKPIINGIKNVWKKITKKTDKQETVEAVVQEAKDSVKELTD